MFISQSLIKQMVSHGNVIDHCPAYLYFVHITKQIKQDATDPMMLGNLFEHKALNMPGRAPSIRKDARTKKPLVSTQRVLIQAEVFKQDAIDLEIFVEPEFNTQVTIVKRWEYDNRVILKGKLDLFPTTFKIRNGLELNIIDMKLTGNIKNTFGNFGWGNPEAIDHLQGIMYWYLVRDVDYELNDLYVPDNYLKDIFTKDVVDAIKEEAYSFRYMIYDYSKDMNKQIIKVEATKARIQEMHESIRKVVSMLEEYNTLEWPTYPHNGCKKCPVLHCKDRQMEIIL